MLYPNDDVAKQHQQEMRQAAQQRHLAREANSSQRKHSAPTIWQMLFARRVTQRPAALSTRHAG
jgi:hypothetical protein